MLFRSDLWALSEIAEELGLEEDRTHFVLAYESMKQLVNTMLWNEALGIYCNRTWDGTFSEILSPTCFYPMLAGISGAHQSERMIREHLLNENEFWGTYVIPSVSKSCAAFADNDYWRGRIWGPMNFLVHEGLKRAGHYDVSFLFAQKSQELFMKEWTEDNHIHENYNSVTGDGDDRGNADPVYTWGALLAYTALSEWIDVEPWNGIRLGHLSAPTGEVVNYRIGENRYRVAKHEGMTVEINDQRFLQSDIPLRITGLGWHGEKMNLQIATEQNGSVEIRPGPGITRICATVNGCASYHLVMENGACIIPLSSPF